MADKKKDTGQVTYESARAFGTPQTAPAEASWGRDLYETLTMSAADKGRLEAARKQRKAKGY